MAVFYGLLLVAILAVLPHSTYECATNGICGMGPSCGASYQPPPSCGCQQRGYQCGSYGCYRHRVRGAKSFQPHRSRARAHSSSQSSVESDRELLRESIQPMGITSQAGAIQPEEVRQDHIRKYGPSGESEELEIVSQSVAANRRRDGPIDPNRAFFDCCLDRKLPDACLSKCNFGTFNKQSLTNMYFKQDPCPLEAMKEMQFCAAQGRDHTDCCARNGVTTTLAGAKCLMFCDQRLGRETRLDMSFVPCFDRFESMKSCFWHDLTRYYRA